MRLANYNPRTKGERGEMLGIMQSRERRAMSAYWKYPGQTYPHPPETVTHFEHEGLEYVELSADVTGPLATYRVRNDEQLKRMKRLPDFSSGVRVFKG